MKRGHLGNERAQAALRRRESAARQQRIDDLRAVLGMPAGRRLVLRLVLQLKGGGAPLWASSAEIHCRTARHDAGLELELECKRFAPALHRQMVTEGLEAEEQDERAREIAVTQGDNDHDRED